ncbi:tripartite tricarboxylate transporter TctB family protein [Saccharopolyspora sp. 5N708]|uniref:tripartite tricarboxylate transporter TctB family protein n=1 Tax=Saccharopolyspora sp. 5N708 TaxID=3457424 RepID=UPI003FD6B632
MTSLSKSDGARRPDLWITGVLLVVFVVALLLARQWGFRASLVPTLVSGLGVVLSALNLVLLVARRGTVQAPEPDPEPEPDRQHEADYVFATAGAAAWRGSLGWLAAFFVGLFVFGLIPTAVVFALAYLKAGARVSWLPALGYAAGLGLALWLVFVELLAIPIPEGLFS